MKPWVRWVVVGAAAIGIVVLFVALQPDEIDAPSPSPSSLSPTHEPTPTGSDSAAPLPDAREIEVSVSGGQIEGPDRPGVQQGETVLLVVRADVSDEVHVHVYDLTADVAPGQPARIRFTADVPGIFEIELEDAGLLLLELEITP